MVRAAGCVSVELPACRDFQMVPLAAIQVLLDASSPSPNDTKRSSDLDDLIERLSRGAPRAKAVAALALTALAGLTIDAGHEQQTLCAGRSVLSSDKAMASLAALLLDGFSMDAPSHRACAASLVANSLAELERGEADSALRLRAATALLPGLVQTLKDRDGSGDGRVAAAAAIGNLCQASPQLAKFVQKNGSAIAALTLAAKGVGRVAAAATFALEGLKLQTNHQQPECASTFSGAPCKSVPDSAAVVRRLPSIQGSRLLLDRDNADSDASSSAQSTPRAFRPLP